MLKRHGWRAILFLIAIFVLGLLVWRIIYYYQQIRDGRLSVSEFSFSDRLTTSTITRVLAAAPAGAVEVESEDDPTLGSKDAPLVIVEFADFSCPYSRQVSDIVRRLAQNFGDQVRFVYRDFPLVDVHPQAARAAQAAACAHDQHEFWSYHDKLFQNQDDFSDAALISYAEQIGLDVNEFQECLDSGLFEKEVADDLADGLAAGVVGTPTFFFNGQKVEGAIPAEVFESLIRAFLESSSDI